MLMPRDCPFSLTTGDTFVEPGEAMTIVSYPTSITFHPRRLIIPRAAAESLVILEARIGTRIVELGSGERADTYHERKFLPQILHTREKILLTVKNVGNSKVKFQGVVVGQVEE